MEEKKSAYKTIVKTTSLFGGTQVFQILLNLIRGKVIALLLGANGMGINSLLQSTVVMVNNIASLGLDFSAVRDISQAVNSGDSRKLSQVVGIFRNWLWISIIIGMLILILFSSLLSYFAFKTTNYGWAFIALSLMLMFNILTTGNAALLRGTRSLKAYAKLALVGSLIALLVSCPIYYLWGIKAIVPVLVISSAINYLFSRHYVSAINVKPMSLSFKDSFKGGLDMVKLGIAMMGATSIGSLVAYIVNTLICYFGTSADLGLYQASMSITSQSIGLVFTAMAVDYFPRLSAVCHDNVKIKEMANQQGEVTLLLAAPVLLLLILCAPLMIQVLLSKEFLPAISFVRILALGMLFKAASYSIGAISFAKGDKKTFFILEGCYTNFSTLCFNVIGYYFYGLTGLAYSFLMMHVTYFIVINIVNWKLYDFSISREVKFIMLVQFCLIVSEFLILLKFSNLFGYILAILLTACSLLFSYKLLDKKIGIREIIYKKLLHK